MLDLHTRPTIATMVTTYAGRSQRDERSTRALAWHRRNRGGHVLPTACSCSPRYRNRISGNGLNFGPQLLIHLRTRKTKARDLQDPEPLPRDLR